MPIKNIADAEEILAKYIPKVKEMTGKDITLETMRPLMEVFDNSQDKLKIVHVAGTSGKTSTSYYLAKIFELSGKKVGLTVSPHIDLITERVQVNGEPISEKEFCNALKIFEKKVQDSGFDPSYFEYLVAFSFWYFNKVGVDYAVIETGLGGTFDSTNIASSLDKVCVITDIGFDHMHILGNTIEEIASQKAGIIHKGNVAFKYNQNEDIDAVFTERVQDVGATINFIRDQLVDSLVKDYDWLEQMPDFQKRNFGLALSTIKYISERDGFNIDEANLGRVVNVKVPGRMDIVFVSEKVVIMDGAHNGQKMKAFVESYKSKFSDKKVVILFSIKKGKEHKEILEIIRPIAKKIIVTGFSVRQDRVNMSADPKDICNYFLSNGIEAILIEDQDKAYEHFIESIDKVGIITGSFYLLANLRQNHEELRSV